MTMPIRFGKYEIVYCNGPKRELEAYVERKRQEGDQIDYEEITGGREKESCFLLATGAKDVATLQENRKRNQEYRNTKIRPVDEAFLPRLEKMVDGFVKRLNELKAQAPLEVLTDAHKDNNRIVRQFSTSVGHLLSKIRSDSGSLLTEYRTELEKKEDRTVNCSQQNWTSRCSDDSCFAVDDSRYVNWLNNICPPRKKDERPTLRYLSEILEGEKTTASY